MSTVSLQRGRDGGIAFVVMAMELHVPITYDARRFHHSECGGLVSETATGFLPQVRPSPAGVAAVTHLRLPDAQDDQGHHLHESVAAVIIWRMRRTPHFVSCVFEQIGEECFELRVLDGKDVVLAESFEETPQMLTRAEQLRTQWKERHA